MHILLLGTSSVGKSTLSQYFKEIGYTHISCDNYGYKMLHYTNLNQYYSGDERMSLFYDEQMYLDGMKESNPFILYDCINYELCNLYKKNNQSLFTVLLYASPIKLIDNIYKRRTKERRGWSALLLYTDLFEITQNYTLSIDKINKNEFKHKLQEKLMFLFRSELHLNDCVKQFFIKLGDLENSNQNEFYIKPRNVVSYNIIVDVKNYSPQQVFKIIQSTLHPNQCNLNHILLIGPTCTGKTSIGKHFQKMGYTFISRVFFQNRMQENYDFNRYYADAQEENYLRYTLSMYNQGKDKEYVLYEDVNTAILTLYQTKKLYSIFLHKSITQIIETMHKTLYQEIHDIKDLDRFADMYIVSNKDEKYLTTISYNTFKQLLLTYLQFFFNDEQQINEYCDDFFKKLNIEEINKDQLYYQQ